MNGEKSTGELQERVGGNLGSNRSESSCRREVVRKEQ